MRSNALTNMDDVPFPINHDIPIVPILDLQDVACDGVSGHGLNEVQAGSLKGHGIFPSVFRSKESKEIVDFSTTHLVSRRCVRYDINNSALGFEISESFS